MITLSKVNQLIFSLLLMVVSTISVGQNLLSYAKAYDQSILLSKPAISSTQYPENHLMEYYHGIQLLNGGNLQEAKSAFLNSLQDRPNNAKAYHWLSRISIQQKEFQGAIEMASKSLSIDPHQYDTHLDLFLAYSGLQLPVEARLHLVESAKLNPEYVTKRGARLIIEKDDFHGAMYLFSAVHEAAPGHILNALNYSRGLMIAGEYTQVEQVLADAYDLNAGDEEHFDLVYTMYFNSLLENKKYDTVLELASKKVNTAFYHQYYYKAMSYFHNGDDAQFTSNASLYFQYQGQSLPSSLKAWANANSHHSEIGAD